MNEESHVVFQKRQPIQHKGTSPPPANHHRAPPVGIEIKDVNIEQIEKDAHKESVKEVVKEEETNRQLLNNLVTKSDRVLFETDSIFPFDLFPDRVVITEEKVSAIQKNFFFSESVRSVLGKDIASVTCDTNIFFATLTIIDRLFTQEPIVVRYLWKSHALKARRIIQGMIVSSHQNIDIAKINTPDIREKLEAIGRAAIT